MDDGSTDGTADAARASADGRLAVRVVVQPNRGRFEHAVPVLAHARGDYVLLLDSRVQLAQAAFASSTSASNPHPSGTVMSTSMPTTPGASSGGCSPSLPWRDYFDDPRHDELR